MSDNIPEWLSPYCKQGAYIPTKEDIEKLEPQSRDEMILKYLASDLSNYYTKSEVDNLIDASDLSNYYTKSEVDNLIDAIPKFDIEVVQNLPISNISPTTVYLVPSQSESSDIYKEYIYVNNNWELLGIQKSDLSNYYTKSETNSLVNGMINVIYPVGAIYMSVNSTSPATLFGGTWEQLSNRFIVGVGSNYSAGTTGGSSTHYHTTGDHTLTVNEIPNHDHSVWLRTDSGIATTVSYVAENGKAMISSVNSTGGDQPHNHGNTSSESNLPPYLAVYMWKRTA